MTPVIRSQPLEDQSGGYLRGWPGGTVYLPHGPTIPIFRRVRPNERPVATVMPPSNPDERVYCKYCCSDVLPLPLREEIVPGRRTEMTICSACGAGLTPPERKD